MTRAKYQYWDGQAYAWATDHTSYDAMENVVKTTDQNNREISHAYDKLGRQLTTIYAPGVYTESHYNCCSVEWTKDEDGRYTYYAYDGAKRVTDIWTDITGQSGDDPLVEHTYDAWGNVSHPVGSTQQPY